MPFFSISAIVLSVIYGLVIGQNDAANSFGDWIGARVADVRIGLLLCGTFAFLGAFLEGGKVIKTIGGGIVPQIYMTNEIAFVGMIAAILWVFLASRYGLPVSTTHAAVGGIGGIGLALIVFGNMPQEAFNMKILLNIFICWISTPTTAMLLAFCGGYVILRFIKKFRLEQKIALPAKIMLTISSSYVAYTWGANDVANAMALLFGSNVLPAKAACAIGGASIAIGAIFLGRRVAETVGFQILRLTPIIGVIADFSAAITIHAFTQLEMPVSTTHALVGAIFGVGLAKGANLVNFKTIREIVIAWVLTPVITFAITFSVYFVYESFSVLLKGG